MEPKHGVRNESGNAVVTAEQERQRGWWNGWIGEWLNGWMAREVRRAKKSRKGAAVTAVEEGGTVLAEIIRGERRKGVNPEEW